MFVRRAGIVQLVKYFKIPKELRKVDEPLLVVLLKREKVDKERWT